jgi:hypothetical protein
MTRLAAIGLKNDRTILGMIEYIAQPICAIQLGSCAVNINGFLLPPPSHIRKLQKPP